MAKVTVKLFGVLRMDTHLAKETLDIDKVEDLFLSLNETVDKVYAENRAKDPTLKHPEPLAFKHAVVFVNGERCPKKNRKLSDGDEILRLGMLLDLKPRWASYSARLKIGMAKAALFTVVIA